MRFSEAIMDEKIASRQSNLLYIYGLYLANGGTPDKFMEMTQDDVDIMFASYMALHKNQTKDILTGIVTIVNKVLGGKD